MASYQTCFRRWQSTVSGTGDSRLGEGEGRETFETWLAKAKKRSWLWRWLNDIDEIEQSVRRPGLNFRTTPYFIVHAESIYTVLCFASRKQHGKCEVQLLLYCFCHYFLLTTKCMHNASMGLYGKLAEVYSKHDCL